MSRGVVNIWRREVRGVTGFYLIDAGNPRQRERLVTAALNGDSTWLLASVTFVRTDKSDPGNSQNWLLIRVHYPTAQRSEVHHMLDQMVREVLGSGVEFRNMPDPKFQFVRRLNQEGEIVD